MDKIILATESSKHLKLDNADLETGRFPDGEVMVVLKENVKDQEVVVIGGTEPPAENLMELLLTLDTVNRHGAKKIKLIIPYLGYGKSDREKVPGQPVSARVLINLIESIGGPNLNITGIDIHSAAVEKFFSVPLTKISLMKELAKKFEGLENFEIVSPDEGGVERAKEFAGFLGKTAIVTIRKNRLTPTSVKILEIDGDVSGKNVVIVDDIVQSGGTILEALKVLKEKGAKDIYLAVTHMDYAGGGWEKLTRTDLVKKVVTTNTIKPVDNLPSKFEVVDVASAILRMIG